MRSGRINIVVSSQPFSEASYQLSYQNFQSNARFTPSKSTVALASARFFQRTRLNCVIPVGQATPSMLTIYLLPSHYSDCANGWSAGGVAVLSPVAAKIMFEKSRPPAQPPLLWVLELISQGRNGQGVKSSTDCPPSTAEIKHVRVYSFNRPHLLMSFRLIFPFMAQQHPPSQRA